MADDPLTDPSGGMTGDRRSAPGAMNSALGRTGRDLAAADPAGLGPDPIAGTDADLFSNSDDADRDGRGEAIREHERNPDIPPDERLGLRPTVAGDGAPEVPVHPVVADAGSRAAAGAVAGALGAAALVGITYLLYAAGVLPPPGFVGTARAWLGEQGVATHVLGAFGFLVAGGLWGALFGVLVRRPNVAKGMLFGVLPTLFLWLVMAPLNGQSLFMGGGTRAILLPLLFNVIVWGGITGTFARRWLRTPSTSAA